MKPIDLAAWSRRSHFEHFSRYAQPFFDIAGRVDVSGLTARAAAAGESLFAALLYEVTAAVQRVPALRQRVRGGEVVEYERVHPSFTVLVDEEHFNFATVEFTPERGDFLAAVAAEVARRRGQTTLDIDADVRGDLVFVTTLPWLDFTAVTHAMSGWPEDTYPRLAWGKVVARDGRHEVAFQVTAHHALVDGVHVARLFRLFEEGCR
jgi:chloramphenicol O-acetyltransferase